MTSGGSIMGVRFLDMFPEEMDLRTDFINYVKGQNAIAKVTGSLPPPPKKPRKQRTGKSDLADEKYAQYNKGRSFLHLLYYQLPSCFSNGWLNVCMIIKIRFEIRQP
jgi:hypothetical protein